MILQDRLCRILTFVFSIAVLFSVNLPISQAVPNGTCVAKSGIPCASLTCNTGYSDCDGQTANGCEINTSSDPKNCGSCGKICAADSVCNNGACTVQATATAAPACSAGMILQNGKCVSSVVQTVSPNAAAAISSAGVARAGLNGSCVAKNGNSCFSMSCDTGYADCDGRTANGCETNVTTDLQNCGACGKVCSAGSTCTRGVCNQPGSSGACTPGPVPNGNCIATPSGPKIKCNDGMKDCDNLAANGCEVNVSSDSNNCGVCGLVCQSGKKCFHGGCVSR